MIKDRRLPLAFRAPYILECGRSLTQSMIVDHKTLLAYYKHHYWHELKESQKEQFRNGVMNKYGKDCGLACYNYEFQRYVARFENYFNELAQQLGIPSDL